MTGDRSTAGRGTLSDGVGGPLRGPEARSQGPLTRADSVSPALWDRGADRVAFGSVGAFLRRNPPAPDAAFARRLARYLSEEIIPSLRRQPTALLAERLVLWARAPWRLDALCAGRAPRDDAGTAPAGPMFPPPGSPPPLKPARLSPGELAATVPDLEAVWSDLRRFRINARIHPAYEFARIFRNRQGGLRAIAAASRGALRKLHIWRRWQGPATHQLDEIDDQPLWGRPPSEGATRAPRSVVPVQWPATLVYAGAPWLEEMLQYEGALRPAGHSGQPKTFLAGVANPEDVARVSGVLSGVPRETERLVWFLDEFDAEALHRLDRVDQILVSKASDAHDRNAFTKGMPVLLVPPCVQPKLHNPIGWWYGREGVVGNSEDLEEMPNDWRRLIRAARSSAEDGKAVDRFLDWTEGRSGMTEAPAWQDPEMQDAWTRSRRLRRIFRGHTLSHRMSSMFRYRQSGLSPDDVPTVSVLLCSNRPKQLQFALEQALAQNYRPLEIVVVMHGPGFDVIDGFSELDLGDVDVRVLRLDERLSLGECLQVATDASAGELLAKFDDDDWYAPFHIETMTHALMFNGAGIAGRRTELYTFAGEEALYLRHPGAEYSMPIRVRGGSMVIRREVFDVARWRPRNSGEDMALSWDCLRAGIPIVTGDRFGTVVYRGNREEHTWNVEPTKIQRASVRLDSSIRKKDVLR